jgi:hypothetical protein
MNFNTVQKRLERVPTAKASKYRWYQNSTPLVMIALYLNDFGLNCEAISDEEFYNLTGIKNLHTTTGEEQVQHEEQLKEFCAKYGLADEAQKNASFVAASIIATIKNHPELV